MAITLALADANVLFSKRLRDWLILLQLESRWGLYKLCWTEDIMAETIYRIRRANPTLDGGAITKIRDQIVESTRGGRIDDFAIDRSFLGSDEHDQHVHAAAIAAGATYLITADGAFRSQGIDLDAVPYEVHDPDSFLCLVDDSAPDRVRDVTKIQENYWSRKPRSRTLVEALGAANCEAFAKRVLEHLSHLPA